MRIMALRSPLRMLRRYAVELRTQWWQEYALHEESDAVLYA